MVERENKSGLFFKIALKLLRTSTYHNVDDVKHLRYANSNLYSPKTPKQDSQDHFDHESNTGNSCREGPSGSGVIVTCEQLPPRHKHLKHVAWENLF